MSRRRLPPLGALHAFEAAARHQSFARAAEELHLTDGAISHRIRDLEDRLGVRLFRRLHRKVVLTEHGRRLFATSREMFDLLARGLGELEGVPSEPVRIAVPAVFATRWLLPRLDELEAAVPGIEPHLMMEGAGGPDSDAVPPDLIVRIGARPRGVDGVDRLAGDMLVPVAAPVYLARVGRPAAPEALTRYRLLRGPEDAWASWFRSAGIARATSPRGPVLGDHDHLLGAAIAGHGVALAPTRLVAADIAAGRLARLFATAVPWPDAYWLIRGETAADRPDIDRVAAWLGTAMAEVDSGLVTRPPPMIASGDLHRIPERPTVD
ncbi:LysR family transcriptional regulator [Tistrella bauzanensis]|uniref:LysR family transcriptional regulator n=1 Tax=Tistrella TaxID=171436 RepID=UPI0031F6A9FC